MIRFKLSIVICLLMALAVPFSATMAVSAGSPTYTHYIYMFGHASWLHYAVNIWSLMVLHNLFRWYRVIAAYLWAVVLSYFVHFDKPLLGASVIVCFFIGMIILNLWKKQRLSAILTVVILFLTCFLPGFAGIIHIQAFLFGLLFFLIEMLICHIHKIIKP